MKKKKKKKKKKTAGTQRSFSTMQARYWVQENAEKRNASRAEAMREINALLQRQPSRPV